MGPCTTQPKLADHETALWFKGSRYILDCVDIKQFVRDFKEAVPYATNLTFGPETMQELANERAARCTTASTSK
ncbi:unannotated protein [freshwater metagenome]|uniref:Unannotated protein n=1 Tax=freshwater metagenome TaxID=449393 RepID=A0A6J7DBT8_9ZZZZ